MSRRTRIGACLAAALLASLGAGQAAAGLLQVPEDYFTIAAALAGAIFSDTVSIAAGTYYEHDLVWPPGVSILGRASSPEWVIIDAQYEGRVMGGEDLVPQNELAFLTLRNGRKLGGSGSGLRAVGDPYLHDLIIEHCTSASAIYGVGLYASGGPTIVDCVLRHNQTDAPSTKGGGAWLETRVIGHDLYVRNLEAYDNDAYLGSGIYINSHHCYLEDLYIHDNLGDGIAIYNGEVDGIGPTIENSLIENNRYCGVAFDAGMILRNCTIVGNGTPGWPAGAVMCFSTWDHPMDSRITQCIVAFNHGPGIVWTDWTPFAIDCNDVFGNAGGNYGGLPNLTGLFGNISQDPLFCLEAGGPYGLQPVSPCAPENNGCGLLMGDFPVSCGTTSTVATSWSALKTLY